MDDAMKQALASVCERTFGEPGEVLGLRFDLAWTLVLAATSLGDEARLEALQNYERRAGSAVKDLAWLEVGACGRRLADILVSMMHGPESMGMRPNAGVQMLRNSATIETSARMLFQRTGIRIPAADGLQTSRVRPS